MAVTRIACNLSTLMGKKKIRSVLQLSKMTGLDRGTLTRLWKETAEGVSFRTLLQLCTVLQCDVGDLLHVERDERPSSFESPHGRVAEGKKPGGERREEGLR